MAKPDVDASHSLARTASSHTPERKNPRSADPLAENELVALQHKMDDEEWGAASDAGARAPWVSLA